LLGMGEWADFKGEHQTALNYFAAAYLSGRGGEPARKRVEAAYRKVHPTKPNELEEWLDAKYRQDYPTLIKAERYTPTPARTNRVVLAEVFSGSSCGPCVAADLAFEAALERYDTRELAVLMYHIHIPDVDPLATPASEARKEFYGVNIAPSAYFNGVAQSGIGGGRSRVEESFAKIKPVIEKSLESYSEAALRISAMQQGSVLKVKVTVDNVRSSSSHLRLHLALVEDEVRYTSVNGLRFHPMVVRAMAGERAAGFALKADKPSTFEQTFELQNIEAAIKAYLDDYELNGRTLPTKFDVKKHEIDRNRLSLVTFIQDNQTKKILQAIYLKLPSAVERTR
jgi:thiol-disulfide isomerase/thioredoxin